MTFGKDDILIPDSNGRCQNRPEITLASLIISLIKTAKLVRLGVRQGDNISPKLSILCKRIHVAKNFGIPSSVLASKWGNKIFLLEFIYKLARLS